MPLFKVTVNSEVFVVAEDNEQATEKVYEILTGGDLDDDMNSKVSTRKVSRVELTKKDLQRDLVATDEMMEKSGVFSDYITVEDYFKMKDALA